MNIRTRTLAGFIAKEFTQIFRDPKMIVALFFIPLMQLIMFGLALTSEVKNIEFAVVSRPSALAREVQTRALASGWFKKAEHIDGANVPDPAALLTQRRAEAVLVAPRRRAGSGAGARRQACTAFNQRHQRPARPTGGNLCPANSGAGGGFARV